ncbi:MAG TPA: hypothetical protein VIY71_05160 [Solirubrobacterales bacterium]
MSSDLIAWVVGITLGIAVVGLGLRRNLDDVTRTWLPRFGEAPESVTATLELSDGGQGRRPLSPRQRRFAIWAYLLLSVCNVAFAVLWADNRLLHAINAALFAIGAVVLMLKRSPSSLNGSTS